MCPCSFVSSPPRALCTHTRSPWFRCLPQVLAALQYSRQTEGIWFLDPQAWVSQHLFKEASIWDIPLVKPRFTCAINPTLMRRRARPAQQDLDVADVLRNSLDFFSKGGKCPNGQIDVKPNASPL